MQLHFVAPFFVYLLWSRRWLGLGSLLLGGVYSTYLRYTVTYNRKLSTVVYFGTPYVYGLLVWHVVRMGEECIQNFGR
jgi:hypothetical protein